MLPPGRFSTMIGWPQSFWIFSPISRMKMSLVPPALVAVMARIGRVG
jgi:hypothetical protein